MSEFPSVASTSISLENERLRAELEVRLEELRAWRESAIGAAEAMRRRMERNLHDGIQQRLVSLGMSLGLLEAKLPADPAAAKPIATEARATLAVALDELRELSQDTYPSVLIERGLAYALQELCDRAEVSSHLRTCLQGPPPDQVAAAAYFAVSEALTNVAKHARASTVHVFVGSDHQELIVEIYDDGIGGASTARGSGLRGLTDRVEALGGQLTVSSPLGTGTNIRAEIPFGPLDPRPGAADPRRFP